MASTHIMNVDTMEVMELGTKKLTIEGYLDNYVVYTREAPNKYNKDLYIKSLNSQEPELLIEQNIYRFCSIIEDKLFYYIGNSQNQSLINISCDGTARKQWPQFISDVVFNQGGWVYFIRKAGYNSILCKARLDGSQYSIIAADIEQFIELKNGYLYYINDKSSLVKVRMDGSNLQELCRDVESVLSVREDKIIFISIDDRISTTAFDQISTKLVKSIYAVEFSGSGKIKLAYNIKFAKKYDDNKVYYIAAKQVKATSEQPDVQMDMLYRLDVESNQTEKLLHLQVQPEKEKTLSGFAIAMMSMAIGLFLAFVGAVGGSGALAVFGLLVGLISLMVGCALKFMKE